MFTKEQIKSEYFKEQEKLYKIAPKWGLSFSQVLALCYDTDCESVEKQDKREVVLELFHEDCSLQKIEGISGCSVDEILDIVIPVKKTEEKEMEEIREIKNTISSLEVAQMMEVEHRQVLRKLDGDKNSKGIIKILTDNKIVVSDYFIPNTYKDESGKVNRCYDIIKLGCDFLANKFTGEKGILFTAKYVKRFQEMESYIKKPKNSIELLELEFKAIKEVNDKVEKVERKLEEFQQDMPLFGVECEKIQQAKNKKVVPLLGGKQAPAYQNRSLRARVYSDIGQELRRQFHVSNYKAIKRYQVQNAIQIIEQYQPPLYLAYEIESCNTR